MLSELSPLRGLENPKYVCKTSAASQVAGIGISALPVDLASAVKLPVQSSCVELYATIKALSVALIPGSGVVVGKVTLIVPAPTEATTLVIGVVEIVPLLTKISAGTSVAVGGALKSNAKRNALDANAFHSDFWTANFLNPALIAEGACLKILTTCRIAERCIFCPSVFGFATDMGFSFNTFIPFHVLKTAFPTDPLDGPIKVLETLAITYKFWFFNE
jgi:hypothetical protein